MLTNIIKNMGVNAEVKEVFWKNLQEMTALNRISDSEEIADLVLFLASDKARAITCSSFVSDYMALC